MQTKTLRYFVVCGEELHVGRAAERLGIAQPALSQHIKALEERLGVRLFNRANRGIHLTDAGKLFLAEAKRIVEATDNAISLAKEAERGLAGELHVGYCGSALFEPSLQRVASRFMQTYPNVTLAMHERNPADNFDALRDGKVDVAFIRGPLVTSTMGLAMETFARSPLMLGVPAAHPLAGKAEIEVHDLDGEPLVALIDPPGFGLAHSLRTIGERAGFEPRVVLQAGSVMGVLGLVGAGFGCGVVPDLPIKVSLPTLTLRPFADPTLTTEILLLHRKTGIGALLRHFLEITRSVRDE